MLVMTETGFIDVVREPQFEDLVLIYSTDLAGIEGLGNYSRGRIRYDEKNCKYPFCVHMYDNDFRGAFDGRFKSSDIEVLPNNVSGDPLAFECRGWWHEDTDDEIKDGSGMISAIVLPEDVESFQIDEGHNFDQFRAFPLFWLPTDLENEMRENVRWG